MYALPQYALYGPQPSDRVDIAPSTRNADFEVDAKLLGSNRVQNHNLRKISGWIGFFGSRRASSSAFVGALAIDFDTSIEMGVVFFVVARRADAKN